VTYDGDRIAVVAAQSGVEVSAAAITASEPAVRAELAQHEWPQHPESASPTAGGARFFRRVLELAGGRAPGARGLDQAAERLWAHHLEDNLWSRVLEGVPEALGKLRACGLGLCVVSNSEGTLEALLESLGILPLFDAVLDSWRLGVTKPDPRIFEIALERLRVPAAQAVMVGDSIKADVAGATGAGIPAALIDPYDLHPEATVPRFTDFSVFAAAVCASLEPA